MNGTVNMLAAKKVKLHGMKTDKWTTKDRITQFKGLINLYTRDRNVIEFDSAIERKKLHRELINLQKSVETDRNKLDNAVRGDKQKLRNTLSVHKEMQLAYQNSQPKKVIESVHQVNFTKRKVLDKLKYHMKLKSQKLIDLKLEEALLDDRLKYESLGQIQQEKEAQIITGKVQDAMLKQEGAVAIRLTYAQMIAIMKKDALYFDAILTTIENDGLAQSNCFLNATKLGQMATEYLDDRRQEYTTLEAIIIKDMNARKVDLSNVQVQAEKASSGLKQLLRRDSDINTCDRPFEKTKSDTMLIKDLETIERTLQFLSNSTLVPNLEAIYPCLQEQLRQRNRLRKFAKKCQRNRDIIMNKLDHAELMSQVLENTMVETTGDYKNRKKELIDLINKLVTKRKHSESCKEYKQNLIAEIRMGLRQLQQICKPVKAEDEKRVKTVTPEHHHHYLEDTRPTTPEKDEIDGCKIITELAGKLSNLVSCTQEKLDASSQDEAYTIFEKITKERSLVKELTTQMSESCKQTFLQGLFTEVSHQLTREDIKKQSAEIVEANMKNDDLIPVFVPSKKRKFK